MAERREDLRFALEPRHAICIARESFGKNLDRYVATELGIASTIDLTHPTRTNSASYFVRAEFCSRRNHHLFNFAAQLRMTDIGAVSTCFSWVITRNRWPSGA